MILIYTVNKTNYINYHKFIKLTVLYFYDPIEDSSNTVENRENADTGLFFLLLGKYNFSTGFFRQIPVFLPHLIFSSAECSQYLEKPNFQLHW